MTDRFDIPSHRPETARPRSTFWRAAERIARVCTAGELGTLADHHQVGQPTLAARFRAAAFAMGVRRA